MWLLQLDDRSCSWQDMVGQEFDIGGEVECQQLCRDTKHCNYWTLNGNVCSLYRFIKLNQLNSIVSFLSSCDNPGPCLGCSSGPAFPDITICSDATVMHTLILGGETSSGYTASLELITENVVCTPDLPSLPTPTKNAQARRNIETLKPYRFSSNFQAFLYENEIFHCGGMTEEALPFTEKCFSLSLTAPGAGWKQEHSMVFARTFFATSVIGNTVYASGGQGDYNRAVNHVSVESFQSGRGWQLEHNMQLDYFRSFCENVTSLKSQFKALQQPQFRTS